MAIKSNSAGLPAPSNLMPTPKPAAPKATTPTTANQREDRVSTPAFNQTLNVYGTPSTPKTTAAKSTSKASVPAAKTNEQMSADAQSILDQINAINTNFNTSSGGATGGSSSSSDKATQSSAVVPNVAYDTISKILESYNITGLASTLESIRKDYPEATSDDLLTLLQFDPRYNAKFNERFSANAARQKAGMKVLSPAEYLAMEQGYKKTLDAYGLTNFQNQAYYDKFISNDLAVTEVADRVSLAYDRVMNDKNINKAFKDFYPSLTTTDIVSGMLDPTNQFPALERKVKAAEIGGAALRQGLTASELATTPTTSSSYTNVTTGTLGADVLAQQGVTKAAAEAGYSNIATELPTAEKLSSIYGNQTNQYGRLQAEQAQFQGLASAKRAKQNLINLELGTFTGSSGRYQNKTTASQQI